MGRLTISLPENVMALAEAQAAKAGHSVDEYVAELILATADRPIGPELEAELLKGLESPAREFSASAWAEKKQRFEAREAGGR